MIAHLKASAGQLQPADLIKLKKLLRLGTSSYPHESALAMSRAVAMAKRLDFDLASLRDDADVGAIVQGWVKVGTRLLGAPTGREDRQLSKPVEAKLSTQSATLIQNYAKHERYYFDHHLQRKNELAAINAELRVATDVPRKRALERRAAEILANEFISVAHYNLCLEKITTEQYLEQLGTAHRIRSSPFAYSADGKKTMADLDQVRASMIPVEPHNKSRFWALGWRYWTLTGDHVFAARCLQKALSCRLQRNQSS